MPTGIYKHKPTSEETKRKISKSNKGKICSKETRNKLSIAHKGRKLSEETKRKMSQSAKRVGSGLWMKGRKLTAETKEKIRIANIRLESGKRFPRMTGENNPNWKGGVTTKDRLERVKFRQQMQKAVFERDDYTCQLCGTRGGYLQVDHIQSWAEYVELRFSMDNCRTVCMDCHYLITFEKPKPKNIIWGHNLLKRRR